MTPFVQADDLSSDSADNTTTTQLSPLSNDNSNNKPIVLSSDETNNHHPLKVLSTKEEITKHVESTMHRIVSSINAHDFNPNSDPWTLLSPDFVVRRSTVARELASSKLEALEGWSTMTSSHTSFNVQLSSMTTAVHDEKKATCYMDLVSTGGPGIAPGMERSAMTVFCCERDRFDARKWWVISEETLLGPGVNVA